MSIDPLKKILVFLFFILLALTTARLGMAQQTFTTTIYFDYATFLTKEGPITSAARNNFFAFRRAYFTYENRIGERLRFRFRYDADNVSNITAVDFKKQSTSRDGKLRPYMKHLYFELADFLIKNTRLRVGMADTLTWKPAEDKWNYRSVAKTLVDIFRDVTGESIDATSADLGIWYAGALNKYARWAFMISNGSHYTRIEDDKYKKLMGQLHLVPIAGLSLIGYIDYEKQDATASAYTYKLEGYFEMVKNLSVGAEYFVYDNDLKMTQTEEKYNVSGFSVFGNYIVSRDILALFARYDNYEPNNRVGNDKVNLVIAGVDWAPWGTTVKLQPNVWFYDYEDSAKKNDVVFQFTFFLSF